MARSAARQRRTDGAIARAPLLVLAIAWVSCSIHAAEPGPGAARPAPNPASSPQSDAAAAPTLYDVVVDLGRNDAMRREIMVSLRDTSDWKALSDRLEDPALASDLAALESGRDTLSRGRYMELVDADTRIRERVRSVNDATTALGVLTRKLEGELERLDRESALWPQRARLAREREAPAEVQRRTEAAGPELAAMRDRLRERRDQVLVAYSQGLALQKRLDDVRATIAERRERISAELRTSEDVPIWYQGAMEFPHDAIIADLRIARIELVDFLRQHSARLGVLFAVLTALTFAVLRRPAIPGPQDAAPPRHSVGIAVAGSLLSTLVLVAVFAPRGPFIFYRLVGFAMPLLAGVVATKTFAAPISATAWTLVFAVFLSEFRILAETSPGSDRLVLVMQLVPFGVAILHDWRRGALARFLPRWHSMFLRRVVQAVLLLIVVAVIASMVGNAGVARVLAAAVVMAPGFALVFAATAWALDQACAGLLTTPVAQSFRSVRLHGDAVLRVLRIVVALFCWATGVVAFALAHSAFDDLLRIGNYVANASVSAGEVTITFSAILSALLIVSMTWLVTKLVRFVLDHEILPRLDLRTGVPIAISTVVGYVLVVSGFVLALAALGIDLTKVTLLAGALGVGVGLGLQSVVSNFAAGLILMLERPINVGDQIDVGGVLGEVRRIGVRSSTIRTFQGAEVIVPNSDLASKQVTNWTLSDRARRYEIDIGVAYGSDPAQVLALLEAAVRDLPEVQRVPAPRALFTGFGDSSLDFRLFAWVESVDIGLQAQNSMRMAVLRALDEAGIEIPFPQRDLHIRYAPDGPASPVAAAYAEIAPPPKTA